MAQRPARSHPLIALFICALSTLVLPSGHVGGDVPDMMPRTDWSVWPQGYSLLLNEKAMFPHDLAFWRMRVNRSRQLFVDTYLIARSKNTTRELHRVKKLPTNPVLNDVSPYVVTRLPEGGYRSYFRWGQGREWRDWSPQVWFADSADGVRWGEPQRAMNTSKDKPKDYKKRDPHLEMSGEIHGLFYHPEDPDPQRRWKLILADRSHDRTASPFEKQIFQPLGLYTSPDGKLWTWEIDISIVGGPAGFADAGKTEWPWGVGDVLQVRWDGVLEKYVAHSKHVVGPDWRFPFRDEHQARVVMWSESDDLVHFSPPRIYAYPDGEDAKMPGMYGIYEANGFPYESMWLGELSMTANIPHPPVADAPPRHKGGYKRNWIRLTGSRDGRHWYYLGDREDFIPIGGDTSWDAHYLRLVPQATTCAPIVRNDTLWFYYRAIASDHPGLPGLALPKSRWHFGMGAATLRRDGFASINAGPETGEVITRALVFDGDGSLFVNAEPTANDGYIKVSLIEEEGGSIAKYDESSCDGVTRDSTKAAVTWGDTKTLAELKGRYVRLVFHIKNAKLYSFWIE